MRAIDGTDNAEPLPTAGQSPLHSYRTSTGAGTRPGVETT
jgi:hypothetical protein